MNKQGDVIVGCGKLFASAGTVDFYKVRYMGGGATMTHEASFSVDGAAELVEVDGNQAVVFSNDIPNYEVFVYRNNAGVFASFFGTSTQWGLFGEIDMDSADQLNTVDSQTFFPSDMAISDGVASFGWRGIGGGPNPSGNATVNNGALVREVIGNTYDPSVDSQNLNTASLSSGPIVLDESNALLPENSAKAAPIAGNALGQGWFFQTFGVNAQSTAHIHWPVDVPSSGTYQICYRYTNDGNSTAWTYLTINAQPVSWISVLTPTSTQYQFETGCQNAYLNQGLQSFGVATFNEDLVFDQITIQ